MIRVQNTQTISWLFDQYIRERLELDPPYQRKSVWSQQFKDNFIDTILLNYPAPAIFLYQEIHGDGRTIYNVVDGKQRLTTVVEFVRGDFPVSDSSPVQPLRGSFFENLPEEVKKAFWSYLFAIEYLPSSEEGLISDIFDRINRNVSKLTPQELRHAKLDGVFITEAERLADDLQRKLPKNFPRLAEQSRKQMKDVEFVSSLLLLLEVGPQSFSQAELDAAYLARDEEWLHRDDVLDRFNRTVDRLQAITSVQEHGQVIISSRLRNQVDFYSLFGALDILDSAGNLPNIDQIAARLAAFVQSIDDEAARNSPDRQFLKQYYDAARSASSDRGSRQTRIDTMVGVISGAHA